MPEARDINIFRIAETRVNREAVRRWLDSLGADEFELPEPEAVPDAALLVALAAKRCYMSFHPSLNPNLTRVRKDYVEYLDNVLASGHGSVAEHAVFSYAIENCSRVFTAEMNRHRAGMAISEGSLRYIRFDKCVPYWEPLSIRGEDVIPAGKADNMVTGLLQDIMQLPERTVPPPHLNDLSLEERKQLTRIIFERCFAAQEQFYTALVGLWDMEEGDHNFSYKKKVTSCLRRIIGLGVSTGGVWTGNIRALRHIFTMRCAPAAEEEICHVFSRIVKDMAESQPHLFGDFHQDAEGFWRPKYTKV